MTVRQELKDSILEKIKSGKDPLERFFCSQEVSESILAVLVAGRHLLLEGPPGIGKTTAAKIIAKLLPSMKVVEGCRFVCDPSSPDCPDCEKKKKDKLIKEITIQGRDRFVRVQGSSELMPEDLIGDIDPINALKYGIHDSKSFTPGKIQKAHRRILFIDELNRVPQRTQNTLLQVLEEGVTTIGGFDIDVNVDTLVIATENPEEFAGVERISETLCDRFERVRVDYPTMEQEIEIIKIYGSSIDDVKVSDRMISRIASISRKSRTQEDLDRQPSVRTTLSIYEQSQANARLKGRKEVLGEDVEVASKRVLRGRINFSGESSYYEEPESFIDKIIASSSDDE
ncbi:MAG: hypothetical protein A2W05_06690 [Candidatus Schekmanbacteria bacterium RBG_16_38_10]|uniref:Mg-protoporphyrin IX chelatase n=1 Tax=Candidatus Schekmanbacteria bacterium RBG_16_38_10 TaxID=1817879 RepID=A0A1F7RSY4_9BACT|nr:MAG: hypothetical protein A2W05_06690 [Candidatus Schekmanbacteria bacterium RBG_16_38_10]